MSSDFDFARAYIRAFTEMGIHRFEDLRQSSSESLAARLDQIVSENVLFASERNRRVVQRLFDQTDAGEMGVIRMRDLPGDQDLASHEQCSGGY
jgi:hypothetical protein